MKTKFIKLLDRRGLCFLINVNYIVSVRFDDDEECTVVDTIDGSYFPTSSKFENIETFIKATFY